MALGELGESVARHGPGGESVLRGIRAGLQAAPVKTAFLLAGGDQAAAEDLLRLALERACRHWGRVCRSGDPERYVRRILANAANDRWPRAAGRPGRPLGPGDAGPVAGDQAHAVAECSSLIRALAGLPPRQRTVVVLRYYNDLSEAEIADALGCSLWEVKGQASRGLARLRAATGPTAGRTSRQMWGRSLSRLWRDGRGPQ